ncbi:hypothetical protein D3C83_05320 [compost metagenome]
MLLPIRLQRIDEDFLFADGALRIRRQTPSLTQTKELPIGRPVTGSRKARGIDECFNQHGAIAESLHPVLPDFSGCQRKRVAG